MSKIFETLLEDSQSSSVDYQITKEETIVMANYEEPIQRDTCIWQQEPVNLKTEEENYEHLREKQDCLALIHCNNENEAMYNQNYNFGDQLIFYNNELDEQKMDLINESIFSKSDFYSSSDCISVDTQYLVKCEEDLDVENQDEMTRLEGYFTKAEAYFC